MPRATYDRGSSRSSERLMTCAFNVLVMGLLALMQYFLTTW
jgi:hypothetical protein